MDFGKHFKPAPPLRAMLNIGFPFDIMTGSYYPGEHGESILNGGLAHVTGFVGRGNTFKSVLAAYCMLMVLSRYLCANAIPYDCEASMTMARLRALSSWMPNLMGEDLKDLGRAYLTDSVGQLGDVWFAALKDLLDEKIKDTKSNMRTLPFYIKGELIKCYLPTVPFIDSLSQFKSTNVEKIHDDNKVGESGMNVEAMKSGAAKSQMLMQMPETMGAASGYMIMTAHIGDGIVMDQYAPSTKKLQTMKGDQKLKNVPEKFTFLTNNCWFCVKSAPFLNRATKTPEYPISGAAEVENDPDLNIITILNMRGKSGPTALPVDILASQREGYLPSLSEFHFLKESDRYGLGGNDRSYYLELVPDVNLSRTTVRSKIDNDPKLRRALTIMAEMCMIQLLWNDLDPRLRCTPKILYDDLKAKGYDWDKLLNTRGYWVFKEDETSDLVPFLSTMDLLKMRVGDYHPWWYPKLK